MKHGLLSADILYCRKMKSRNSSVRVTWDMKKYKGTDEAKQKKNQHGLGPKSCHHFIVFHRVPALGNNSFKEEWCHMKFATVVQFLSPLADLGRVLGDAVTRSQVGRGEVNGANCQNKRPPGCSLTVLTLVLGGQAQSQATALHVSKANRQVLHEWFLLECFCPWILEWKRMSEPVPLRAEHPKQWVATMLRISQHNLIWIQAQKEKKPLQEFFKHWECAELPGKGSFEGECL